MRRNKVLPFQIQIDHLLDSTGDSNTCSYLREKCILQHGRMLYVPQVKLLEKYHGIPTNLSCQRHAIISYYLGNTSDRQIM